MRIEEKVNEIVDICVVDRLDLSIEHLAYMFDVHIMYNHKRDFYVHKKGIDIIGLRFNKRFEMYKSFCHELGHMLLHCTDQRYMPDDFNAMQEAEANKFALLLMMPEKLIIKHELYEAQEVASYFNMSFDLALLRIDMLIEQTRITTFN